MCDIKQKTCIKAKSEVGKKPRVGLIPSSTIYTVTGEEEEELSCLCTIDPITGAQVFVGFTGVVMLLALAIDPTTHIMYSIQSTGNFSALYTIDRTTGQATFVAPIRGIMADGFQLTTDLAIDARGNAYFLNIDFSTNTVNLYRLNLNNGQATPVTTIFRGTTGNVTEATITFDRAGNAFVTITEYDPSVGGLVTSVYYLNINTGQLNFINTLTFIGLMSTFLAVTGFDFDPATGQFYVTITDLNSGASYFGSLNLNTGAVNIISQISSGTSSMAIDTTYTAVIQPQAPGVKFKMGPCC